MSDYGLFNGLAEGIRNGLEMYKYERDRKDNQRQKELNENYRQAQLQREEKRDLLASEDRELGQVKSGLLPLSSGQQPEKGSKLIQLSSGRRFAYNPASAGAWNPNPLQQLQFQKLQEEIAQKEHEKTPEGRLTKAGGDVKQKIGFLTGALKSLSGYEDVFRGGQRQGYVNPSTPLIGGLVSSTPIDERRTELEEAIGRLASGGAINAGEEDRFRRMLPKAADNDQAAVRKILNLRAELENKLTAYGFQKSELPQLGFDSNTLGYGTEFSDLADRGLLPKKDTGNGLIKEAKAQQSEMMVNGKKFILNPKTGKYREAK